jgi:CubicO group peptidase (beta-lactamase class C family)
MHILDPESGLAVAVDEFKEPESLGFLFGPGCRAMCDYTDVTLYSGGGGLVSTLRDYVRFAEALRAGGILDGNRILSPKTIAFMTMDHLPASLHGGTGEQISIVGNQLNGFGFGLGFGVVTNTAAQGIIGSAGQYWWGGAAGTIFWIDPVEDIVVVSMMQLMRGQRSYRPDLRASTYQALTRSRE